MSAIYQNLKRHFGAVFIILTLAETLASGKFTQIETQGGGWQTGLAQHPNGRIYCRTDVGGVYRSDNLGESWQYLSGSFTSIAPMFVHGLAVSPKDQDLVLISCGTSYASQDPGRGIWKSTNGGRSWKQVARTLIFSGNDDQRQGGEALIFHPTAPTELFAVTRGSGLYHSKDTGDNWSKIGGSTLDNTPLAGVYIHPNFPDQVFAYGSGGCWYSQDRGKSFQLLFQSNLVLRVVRDHDGTLYCCDTYAPSAQRHESKLWKYTATDWNAPNTWERTDILPNYFQATNASQDRLSAVSILDDGSLFVALFFRAPAISTDRGKTFSVLPRTLIGDLPNWQTAPGQKVPERELGGGFSQLLQDQTNPKRLFVTGGYGIARSDDMGQTWSHITKGINEAVCWKVQFHPKSPNKVLLPMADHGLAVLPDITKSKVATNYNVRHFAYPDDLLNFTHTAFYSGSRIIAPGAIALGQIPRIYRSDNDGIDWYKVPFTGLPKTGFHPIVSAVSAPDNPDELLVLLGGTWQKKEGGVYHSTDAGKTFQKAILPKEAYTYKDGKPYYAGDEFVWQNDLHVDGGNSETRYLIQRYERIMKSTDRGMTWATISPSGLEGAASYYDGKLATDPEEEGRLWLVALDGLWTSTDWGHHFQRIGKFTRLNPDVRFDALDGSVVVFGRQKNDTYDHIYYSPNHGKTWEKISQENFRFPDTQGLALDPWRPGTVWISTGGRSVLVFTPH